MLRAPIIETAPHQYYLTFRPFFVWALRLEVSDLEYCATVLGYEVVTVAYYEAHVAGVGGAFGGGGCCGR